MCVCVYVYIYIYIYIHTYIRLAIFQFGIKIKIIMCYKNVKICNVAEIEKILFLNILLNMN